MKRFSLRIAWFIAFVLVGGCEDDPHRPEKQLPDTCVDFAFVTTTDFQTGSAAVVCVDETYTTTKDVAGIHSDAVARCFDGLVYVVNRFNGDNIQVLDPSDGFKAIRQFSVGNGSDPHDIVVVNPTKAYVTRYNETTLWVVDPSTGAQVDAVDLSPLADADGIPEMDHLFLVGERLFVGVQRIDRSGWKPEGTSYFAVVDAAADTLFDVDDTTPGLQPVRLDCTNPFSEIQMHPAKRGLYVACAGEWGFADGGVEMIDPDAMTSIGVVLSGVEAQGDITDVVIASESKGYVVVTDANFNTVLLAFDPESGKVTGTVYAPGGFVLQDVEQAPSGELFVADRTPTRPGIRIFDVETDTELTNEPIDIGLPPFDISFGSKRRR